MGKVFNVNANCIPKLHYMVDITDRLAQIRKMVDAGQYFTINRARQYGKTTTLKALALFLKDEYIVASLDFQKMSHANFESEQAFVTAFAGELTDRVENIPENIREKLEAFADGKEKNPNLLTLFRTISKWCGQSDKGIVLMIDEADSASNNQVFLDFLSQLRSAYIDRDIKPSLHSVILTSVYDIRNIKRKIRPQEEHRMNSPWNIAADFPVDMSFTIQDIAGMLKEYETDYHTGMNICEIATLLYHYTSGYPYLVSRLCKFIDEQIAGMAAFPDRHSAWTKNGVLEAVKRLLEEQDPLFESLIGKLHDYPELNDVISALLFQGHRIAYNPDDRAVQNARMFGFIKVKDSSIMLSNRIFETRLYNFYLLKFSEQNSSIYDEGIRQKNQFVINGHLNMRRILEKFVDTFDFLYGEQKETFREESGRKYFMLFLKPIINGTGNCYVEPETRNRERMDLVIDYLGEQYVCELKIWHGNAYRERGEKQLSDYLDYFHLKKGYMLSFNFNRKKEIGVKEIVLGDKLLIEATV